MTLQHDPIPSHLLDPSTARRPLCDYCEADLSAARAISARGRCRNCGAEAKPEALAPKRLEGTVVWR